MKLGLDPVNIFLVQCLACHVRDSASHSRGRNLPHWSWCTFGWSCQKHADTQQCPPSSPFLYTSSFLFNSPGLPAPSRPPAPALAPSNTMRVPIFSGLQPIPPPTRRWKSQSWVRERRGGVGKGSSKFVLSWVLPLSTTARLHSLMLVLLLL